MALPKAIICDLDRTLCDNTHRQHLFLKRDWEAFFAGIPDDKPNEWCALLVHEITHVKWLFITGRPERYRIPTETWLHDHDMPSYPHSKLFMRPIWLDEAVSVCNGVKGDPRPDHRPTYLVKQDIYEQHIKGKYDVLFVLEDDKKCAQMYKEQGLTVLKVM